MVAEKSVVDPQRAIRLKQRGNAFGFWIFGTTFRMLGLRAAYFLLQFVTTHYLIFDRAAVRSALVYIVKRFPRAGRFEQYRHVRRLFLNQGRQLIDRYALTCEADYFEFRQLDTQETLDTIQDSQGGVVLLTSHVGNWQVALMQMGHLKKRISIVMRPEDNPAVRESLGVGTHDAKPVRVIDPQGHLGGVLEIMEALNEGDLVCMMGDRSYGFDTVEVPFLGHPAYFPYGPFAVAAATGSPVVALLTHKIAERKYIADMSNMWRPNYVKGASKKEQLRTWVGEYVALLGSFVNKHPYDCFLFYDVWSSNKGGDRWRQVKKMS